MHLLDTLPKALTFFKNLCFTIILWDWLKLHCYYQVMLMKQKTERLNDFLQVPLLAGGGGWTPILSSFHFVVLRHMHPWPLSLHMYNRDHIRSCDDLVLAEVMAITCKEQCFTFNCIITVALGSWFHPFFSALSIKHLLLKSSTIIRDDLVINLLSQQMDGYVPLT